jgi:hypothetical protein
VHALLSAQDWDHSRSLLKADPSKASQWQTGTEVDARGETQQWERLPIHQACLFGAPPSFVKELLGLYPESVFCPEPHTDELPLHLACRSGASPEVIELLLSKHPKGCRKANVDGQLPLHLACMTDIESNKNLDATIELLIKAHSAALIAHDDQKLTPLEYLPEIQDSTCDLFSTRLKLEKLQLFWNRVEAIREWQDASIDVDEGDGQGENEDKDDKGPTFLPEKYIVANLPTEIEVTKYWSGLDQELLGSCNSLGEEGGDDLSDALLNNGSKSRDTAETEESFLSEDGLYEV